MSNQLIREHFITDGTEDKFTKIKEFSSTLSFNCFLDLESINNALNSNLPKSLERENYNNEIDFLLAKINVNESRIEVRSFLNELTFYQKGDDIRTILKVSLLVSSLSIEKISLIQNLNILSNSRIIFLIDDSETIECNNCISHFFESLTSTILKEFALIEIDLSTFICLANAKKIETRFIGGLGNMGESELDIEDLINFKGCYNAVYDEYFETDKLIEEIKKYNEHEERIIKENKDKNLKLLQEKLAKVSTEPINDNEADDVSIPHKEKNGNDPFWYIIAIAIAVFLFYSIQASVR